MLAAGQKVGKALPNSKQIEFILIRVTLILWFDSAERLVSQSLLRFNCGTQNLIHETVVPDYRQRGLISHDVYYSVIRAWMPHSKPLEFLAGYGKPSHMKTRRPAPQKPTARPPSDRRLALLLSLLALLVFNANFRLLGAEDTYPARFLPFALWNHGTLYLDPVREVTTPRNPDPYWIQPTADGRSASLYPIVAPLLAAPAFRSFDSSGQPQS